MIVRNHPPVHSTKTKNALHGWGVAFAKIRRNPDTDGQKTNPCLTSDFKNVKIKSNVQKLVNHF